MDKRTITSPENGILGGRPISEGTLRTQKMRELLTQSVLDEFESIFRPQIEKAKKGEFSAYKDLLDRIGIKAIEVKGEAEPLEIIITRYADYQPKTA